MTKHFTLLLLTALSFLSTSAATEKTSTGWVATLTNDKVFIENKGQFDVRYHPADQRKILYAVQQSSKLVYFTDKGVSYQIYSVTANKERGEDWQEMIKEKEEKYFEEHEGVTPSEKRKEKAKEARLLLSQDIVEFTWQGANPNVQVIASNPAADYHTYCMRTADKKKAYDIRNVKGYQKLVYKNLYPNIDVEYSFFPDRDGYEYAVILHPGADPSLVKMVYKVNEKLSLNDAGDLHIATSFGDIIEHAPKSLYQTGSNEVIPSKFVLHNNVVSFRLKNYDRHQIVIIDPWVQTPSFNTQWDCVWECDKDGAGNVYIIGGVMPLQLLKYNSAGTLQWTYNTPYDSTSWLGTFATDIAGNSYVTEGSIAAIQKVSTAGSLVWDNPSPGGIFASTEFWSISFNCDQTKLVIGGTGNTLPPLPYIYQVDMSNGNVTNSLQVTGGALFPTQEVRSITASGNGRYYWLSHDSLGFIKQNFGLCPKPQDAIFKAKNGYSLGYKCENWRYNNSGISAVRTYGNFAFTHRGNQLDKRNFATGAVVGSAAIPGGSFSSSQVGNSGLDIDDCGNIYAGSKNQVVKYDQNLTQLATYPTSPNFNVYDVQVSTNGDIIACGSTGTSSSGARQGYIQSFSAGACATIAIVCCDANICQPPTLCTTDPATTLTASTPGGTWSGTGITNASTGMFNPSVAGPGSHTVVYTLPCGADSVVLVVSPCTTLSACTEQNGNITLSNGVGPYSWQKDTLIQDCSACFPAVPPLIQPCSVPAGCAVNVHSWVTYATGNSVAPPSAYPIRVQDAAGTILMINSAGQLQPCNPCPTITVTVSSQTNVTCPSTNNGSATVSASGGVTPYTYSWNPNVGTSATVSNLTAGAYTVTAYDANNCSGSASVTITAPVLPNISNVATQAETCAGQNDGAITSATASGGNGTFAWTYAPAAAPGNTVAIPSFPVNNLTPGNYIVTVTSGGCTDTAQINIAAGPNCCTIHLSVSATEPSCGQSNGSITLNVTPAATYTYSWSNGLPAQSSQSNVASGQYSVTITNTGVPNCTKDTTIILNNSGGPSLSFSNQVNPSCAGGDGAITVTLAGGTAPYQVTVDTGGAPQTFTLPIAISQTLNNLPAGTVNVSVQDAGGCQASVTATLIPPANCCTFVVSDVITDPGCGTADGSVALTATNGSGNYSYAWTGGATTDTLGSLAAGTYGVTITDNAYANCFIDTTYTLVNPNAPVIDSVAVINETCPGTGDGSATVSASGGNGNLSYVWSNQQTGATASSLTAGNYSFTVSDVNNCQTVGNAIVSSGFCCTLRISAQGTNGSCGLNNASISVSVDTAGTAPYSYSLNGGTPQSSGTFTGLASGTYLVLVTDANSCSDTATVVIQPSSNNLNVSIATTGETCNGSDDATATANSTGGTAPLLYQWSTNETTDTIFNLLPDAYSVTVTDAGGCSGTATTLITEPASITVNAGDDTTACEGNTVTVQADAGYVSYLWSSGETTEAISPLVSGTYSVTVTDTNGCTASDVVIVTYAISPVVDLGNDKVAYQGEHVELTATIIPSSTGGTYNWQPDTLLSCTTCQNPLALATDTMTYVLDYTDANGCSGSDTVTLFVLPVGHIFFPNAFTPNGDGANDIYLPGGSEVKLIVWRIFNRWGEKVFESNSQFIGWNGKYKGALQPPGVYVYYAEVTYMNNETEKFNGSITLLR